MPLTRNLSRTLLTARSWAGVLSLFAGVARYPGRFHLYQPFVGGGAFVVAQAFGWTLFALALRCFVRNGTVGGDEEAYSRAARLLQQLRQLRVLQNK